MLDLFGKKNNIKELEKGKEEARRVLRELSHTKETLDGLDEEFLRVTKLEPLDIGVLFIVIGLQLVRQYLFTKFPARMGDQESARNTPGHLEEHSDRHHRWYNPTLNEIITNPVPFDANIGAAGRLSGGGRLGHRSTALGHDPLIGLVVGTANIATSTLTTYDMKSYHIKTGSLKRDEFVNNARTDLVFRYTIDKLLNKGMGGKEIVAASLMKEIIHLRSDIHTKKSLPFPIISVIDPKIASALASYGIDFSNVVSISKQAGYASLINSIAAMFHGMFAGSTNEMEGKLYRIRTNKIITYSNLVASSSNAFVVAATNDFKKLDAGGMAVTVYNLITAAKFIKNVKEEFIFGSYRNMIQG